MTFSNIIRLFDLSLSLSLSLSLTGSSSGGSASTLSLADLLGASSKSTSSSSSASASASASATKASSQSSAHATKRLGAMQRAARGTGPTARLAAPLAEHERERAERLVEYERAQEEVGKWQPIVKRNREAEQLRYCAHIATFIQTIEAT